MNLFMYWLLTLEPLVDKAIGIIPHLKEIINIAFKQHNGFDILSEEDHKHLSNRIKLIDHKLRYVSPVERRSFVLDKKHRSLLIEEYKNNVTKIENALIRDFMIPTLTELMLRDVNLLNISTNKYMIFYQEEMLESIQLFEKEFNNNPLKNSLIRDLERGLDHLMHIHPGRLESLLGIPAHPGNDLFGKIKSRKTEGERDCITLLSFLNYIMNEMGIEKDRFMNQFYYLGLRDVYTIMIEVYHKRDTYETLKRLTDMFDKLTIQASIVIRLLKCTKILDSKLQEYFFPETPFNEERKRLIALEKRYTDGFSYGPPGFL